MKAYEEMAGITPEQFEIIKTGHFHVAEEDTVVKAVDHAAEDKPKRRSHHPWLHPTKGWRQFARPRKTNRRRKLIPVGRLMVFHPQWD